MIAEDLTRVAAGEIEVAMVAVGEITIITQPHQVDWYLIQQLQNQSCRLMQIPL